MEKFWLVKPECLDLICTPQEVVTSFGLGIVKEEFEKIIITTNPREKIKFIQFMYSKLRIVLYDRSNKKV